MSSAGIKKTIAIFVPGYYGSTLIEPNSKKEIWGDARELFFGRKTLAMPIPGMNVPGALNLIPHQLIPDKKILGGLLKEDAYDKTIALLNSLGVEEIFPVAWDWRRDPILGIRRLDQVVKEARNKYPDHQMLLVSHSFGSLISSYYLRYGAADYSEAIENWEGQKYFSKIILSATPFRGLMAMFRNMLYGIKFGLNHNMQTPLAFSTFESSYYLLPPPGLDTIFDDTGNIIHLNLHDPMNWIENRWGLFHEKLNLPIESSEARKNYVSHHLARAKQWHQLIDAPMSSMPKEKKSLLYLSGYGFKTTNNGVWLKNHPSPNIFLYYPKNFKKWKTTMSHDQVFGDGDLTVPDFSLKLPEAIKTAFNIQHVHEKRGHLDILQHPESQKKITEFLLKADH